MTEMQLPKTIDPVRLADLGTRCEGTYAVADMPRLVTLLREPAGQVDVVLEFGVDAEGLRFLRGSIGTALTLTCQRCVGPYQLGLDLQMSLSPVLDDRTAKSLPEGYEAVIFTGEPIILMDIIEDELMLNLPLVPKHKQADCPVQFRESGSESPGVKRKDSPFKVLRVLEKKRGKHNGRTKKP